MFISQNMVKAFSIGIIFLMLYSSIAYYGISLQVTSSADNEEVLDDDLEDLSEYTPLLGIHSRSDPKASLKKALYAMVLLVVLLLILTSCFLLLVYQFNICPSFSSTPNSDITCNGTPQTYGSICRLTCSPLFWSSSSLHSSCTWKGTWTVQDLACRPQVAAVVGLGLNKTLGKVIPATDMYPPTGSRFHLPGLHQMDGSAAYVNGGLIYCGGFNFQEPSGKSLKTCYMIKPPAPLWEETFPLLKETKGASTTVIEDGQAMMVLGGLDAGNHRLSISQIVRPGQPSETGPDMTEWAVNHCSTTLQDGSVITTGGYRKSNPQGSARTEIYNFTTSKWRQVQDMRQGRMQHTCTQVWVTPHNLDSNILGTLVTNDSVLSILVAGGNYQDGNFIHPINNMELYLPWNDTWIDIGTLPHTPDDAENVLQITDAHIMSFQTEGVISLNVVGGDIMDWNTGEELASDHVWKLMFSHVNHTHFWDSRDVDLMDMFMGSLGSRNVGVPDTFFSSFRFGEGEGTYTTATKTGLNLGNG